MSGIARTSAWTAIAAGSNDPHCSVTGDDTGLGISSELLLPGASPVDPIIRVTA
ncbi:MAG: hypothetical protein JWR34_4180 [Mycobacterium sp.]|nr:hypothetical protein [Mycobacterium sp.]